MNALISCLNLLGDYKTAILNPVKTVAELCNIFYEKRILYRLPVPKTVLEIINHDIKQFIGNKKYLHSFYCRCFSRH